MTPPSAEALAALKDALGAGGWTEDPAEIGPSLTEWRGRWSGATPLMLLPRSTGEVARALRVCVDRRFPLGLASDGTATIGGAVSSNAGGTGVVRYGMMRDLVLGLEAVLPDGEVFHGLKRLRKDNTGYDLKQLLIGAEGTLGVVTAATLKLHPVLRSRATAVVGVDGPQAAVELLARAHAAP